MTPKNGQHVKCVLRTGAVVEGIVQEWANNKVQLRSVDGESVLIIPHPEEDIMIIKIILTMPKINLPTVDKMEDRTEIETSQVLRSIEGSLEYKFQEAEKLPSDDPLKMKTLAELRAALLAQEKKIISEKLRNHYISNTKKAQYGYPGPNKKSST